MKKLIIFLIRKRLGLGKRELFQFSNQKTSAVYYFDDDVIYKVNDWNINSQSCLTESGVSLNWLLSDECRNSIRTDILLGGSSSYGH
jgi:hypothetical protein